jgi:hypothetical protein
LRVCTTHVRAWDQARTRVRLCVLVHISEISLAMLQESMGTHLHLDRRCRPNAVARSAEPNLSPIDARHGAAAVGDAVPCAPQPSAAGRTFRL